MNKAQTFILETHSANSVTFSAMCDAEKRKISPVIYKSAQLKKT